MATVEVANLTVELDGAAPVVEGVSFSIESGEVLGLAGESGSGKTTIGNALIGYSRRGARIAAGTITVDGLELLSLSERELQAARGATIAYVPQDPSASLNPSMRIGTQLLEGFEVHERQVPDSERKDRIAKLLGRVGLPSDREFLRRYPHQLSGGQEQRVLLAAAFLHFPRLIIMDEPTTGLDVTVQSRVLAITKELCREFGAAVLYISHDLAVLRQLVDRVMIAYAGQIVEVGSRDAVFEDAAHPYTRRLLASIPDPAERRTLAPIPGVAPSIRDRPGHCVFAARCALAVDRCVAERPPPVDLGAGHLARCFRVGDSRSEVPIKQGSAPSPLPESPSPVLVGAGIALAYGPRVVLDQVSFSLGSGECLAVVGGSGAGKTSLARAVMGLVPVREGRLEYAGSALAPDYRHRPETVRRELQYVFQSPFRSLNPRLTIGDSVRAPIELFWGSGRAETRRRVAAALERVALPAHCAERYPNQLSGGERQRAAVARALVCEPKVMICDEVTSALDVSVQAAIVELLRDLQREEGLAMLIITHNIALVRSIADRVLVMDAGRVVESGPSDRILDRPEQAYTKTLIAHTPSLHGSGATQLARPAEQNGG